MVTDYPISLESHKTSSPGGDPLLPLYPDTPRGAARAGHVAGSECGAQAQREAPCPPDNGGYLAIVPSNKIMDRIPGMGEIYPKCAFPDFIKKVVVCSSHAEHSRLEVQGSSCGRKECPVCYTTYLNRQADRAGARLDGYQKFDRYRPKHVIYSLPLDNPLYSLPDSVPSSDLYNRVKRWSIDQATSSGLAGGYLIVHLYRVRKELIPPEELKTIKAWDYVRTYPDRWSDLVYFSPHAHVVGYGYLEKVKSGGGFQYKNKGPIKDRTNIERVVRYLLGHAPIIPGRKAGVWFGDCGYSKLKPVNLHQEEKAAVCPVCGAYMVFEETRQRFYRKVTVADDWLLVRAEKLQHLIGTYVSETF